jgi:Spy/CpxP family protein refolding chaperone
MSLDKKTLILVGVGLFALLALRKPTPAQVAATNTNNKAYQYGATAGAVFSGLGALTKMFGNVNNTPEQNAQITNALAAGKLPIDGAAYNTPHVSVYDPDDYSLTGVWSDPENP